MEYMLSGTPVLTTKLPGIPAEYDKYLYYFEDESIEAMANKMSEVLSMDYTECLRKASEAQSYVMNEKNNFLQMKNYYLFYEWLLYEYWILFFDKGLSGVDCSRPDLGNPGVGGTQYCFLLLIYYILRFDPKSYRVRVYCSSDCFSHKV